MDGLKIQETPQKHGFTFSHFLGTVSYLLPKMGPSWLYRFISKQNPAIKPIFQIPFSTGSFHRPGSILEELMVLLPSC